VTAVTDHEEAREASSDAMRALFERKLRRKLRSHCEVGRFVVLRELGHGAMGVVYEAFDPQLERKVALKLLLWEDDDEPDETAARRLLQEAQALAKLAHPNVVAVHDVGLHDGAVWLAMEYVAGQTLHRWATAQRRTWREVLRVLTDAAEGVAAAHAAGLVHRDLKPENVMISAGGRVRVMDFGLASRAPVPDLQATVPMSDPTTRLTRPGAIPGTPAYYAPEQWEGADADPATDQFSWCVMAWELLYGQRPFVGTTRSALAAAVTTGRREPPPTRAKVPRWLRRIVEHGLAVDPHQRFADMGQLTAALKAGPPGRFVLVAVIGCALAVALGVAYQARRSRAISTCDAAGAAIIDTWDEAARMRLRAGLLRTSVPLATITVEKILPRLDAYAIEWSAAATVVCGHAMITGDWTPELTAEGHACLAERRQHLDTLVETLSDPVDGDEGRGMVTAAGMAVAGLPAVDACLDEARLRARPRATDAQRGEAAQAVRLLLARSTALMAAGQPKAALVQAEDARHTADALGWRPLQAAVAYRRGALQSALADYKGAETTLEQAYFMAGESGEDEVFADAAGLLSFVVGYHLSRRREGIRWGKAAEMHLTRASTRPDNLRRAAVLDHLGSVYQEAGQLELAIAHFERALMIVEEAMGADHPGTLPYIRDLAWGYFQFGDYDHADVLIAKGLTLAEQSLGANHYEVGRLTSVAGSLRRKRGDYAGALQHHEAALAIYEDSMGSAHPIVATSLTNIAFTRDNIGDEIGAIRFHERALIIVRAAYGDDNQKTARALANLGGAYNARGEYAKAIENSERALASFEKLLGPDHPDLAPVLNTLGLAHRDREQNADALEYLERCLSILKATRPEHHETATVMLNLSPIYYQQGEHRRAVESIRRALEIHEKNLGPDSLELVSGLVYLGYLETRAGDARTARPILERALGLIEGRTVAPSERAKVLSALAEALWIEPGERRRAREMAVAGRNAWREAGPRHVKELADAESWLGKHTI
jgi:tetratricopeptide (TPR) repeat protein/predicted Ser/Thr protein kinase